MALGAFFFSTLRRHHVPDAGGSWGRPPPGEAISAPSSRDSPVQQPGTRWVAPFGSFVPIEKTLFFFLFLKNEKNSKLATSARTTTNVNPWPILLEYAQQIQSRFGNGRMGGAAALLPLAPRSPPWRLPAGDKEQGQGWGTGNGDRGLPPQPGAEQGFWSHCGAAFGGSPVPRAGFGPGV